MKSEQSDRFSESPGGSSLPFWAEEERRYVRARLIDKAIQHGVGAAPVTLFAVLGVVAIHWLVNRQMLSLPWAVGMVLVTLVRAGMLVFLVKYGTELSTQTKERLFLTPMGFTSFGWMLLPVLVFPEAPSVEKLGLICVVSGLAGGAATVLAPLKWSARLYLVSVLLPSSIMVHSMPGGGQVLSYLGVCFLAVMLFSHRNLHRETIQALRQVLENQRLVDQAKRHREEVERLNRDLLASQAILQVHNAELAQEVADRARSMHLAYAVVKNTTEGVMVIGADGLVLEVNPAFSSITGYSPTDIIGATPAMLQSDRHEPSFFAGIVQQLQEEDRWAGEVWSRRKDGSLFLERRVLDAVRDDKGGITHYISIFNDITDSHAKDEQMRHMAFHDALTGLANRPLLQDRLQLGIVQAKRRGKRMAVLYLDLDHFKSVNDSLGHHTGDLLLQAVAARLRRCARESDTLARLGGDEFVVLLNDLEDSHQCSMVAGKLLETISEPLDLNGTRIHVRTSVGIALYPDDGEDADTLMKCADMALYAAKAVGRNTFRYFHRSLSEQAQVRLEMETALREALEQDQFSLHFQPKVAAEDGHTMGYEALLRWQHPVWGNVPPDRFVPAAEEAGLIRAIGAQVIHKACAHLAAWHQAGHGWKHVAINVSARQLEGDELLEQILRETQRFGVPCTALEVEVTESVVVANPEQTLALLQRLRSLGVTIAIDDFGTGQSSLAYLRRLPIDVVKIDRAFVQDLGHDEHALAIVELIVALSRTLNLRTVAEGVETEQQAELLRQSGCHIFQGYLFARPQPAQVLEAQWSLPHVAVG